MLSDIVPALGGQSAPSSGGVLFQLTAAIQALTRDAPTLLIIDDLHWADPSSLDVLAYLITGLRDGQRIHLLGTYRDTELPDGHRLHGWLADMTRMPSVAMLPLTRLDLWETEQLVLELLGNEHTALAEQIFGRSGGSPYLIELLVAEHRAGGALQQGLGLRDALLAAWHRLSSPGRRVTQVLAVSGRPVSFQVLGDLAKEAGVAPADFSPALAEAAANGITVEAENGDIWFRHPLLAEVITATLREGDRQELVAAYARAWEHAINVSERDRATHLALHYAAGGDPDRCLIWSLRAADRAAAISAYEEEAEHLAAATEQLPALSPELSAEVEPINLLVRTARAAETAGDYRKARKLYEQTLARIDRDREPLAAARVLLRLSFLEDNLDAASYTGPSRLPEALALTAAFPDSQERAMCLADLAFDEAWAGKAAASSHAEQAVSLAERLGSPQALAWALAVRAQTRWYTDEGIADAERAVALAEPLDDTEIYARAAVCLSNNYQDMGQWAEAARETAKAFKLIRDKGPRTHAANVGCIAADWLLELGRWDEARAIVREILSFRQANVWASYARCVAARLAGLEGNLSAAAMHLHRARELTPILIPVGGTLLLTEIHYALCSRNPTRALDLIEEHITEAVKLDPTTADEYLQYAARAAANLTEQHPSAASRADAMARLERIKTLRGDQPPPYANRGPLDVVHPAHAALYAADRARCAGSREHQQALWAAAVQATDRAGLRYERTRAQYFLAQALLTGRRSHTDAANALRLAHTDAVKLGAKPLAQLIEELAQQAHLSLAIAAESSDHVSADGAYDLQLTPREREILSHIIAGETYAQIAASLIISEKTVSVHVSNLLRKTGTTSRIELAARARQST